MDNGSLVQSGKVPALIHRALTAAAITMAHDHDLVLALPLQRPGIADILRDHAAQSADRVDDAGTVKTIIGVVEIECQSAVCTGIQAE